MQIYDLNIYDLSDRNGMYTGQAGAKEGIFAWGDNWIVKYPKNTRGMKGDIASYMTSPLSEYIGSHVYDILGYDVHETILGIRNEKLVVACRDFCDDDTSLREIRAIKNVYNSELENQLEMSLNSTGSEYSIDLAEMLIHMEYNPILNQIPEIKQRFWDCVIIDGLINNSDRNNGNWGLLYQNRNYVLAPIYDNGAAFSNKMADDKIERIMRDSSRVKSSALNGISTYSLNQKRLLFRDIVKYDNKDLRDSLRRVVPLISEKISEINQMIDNIPEKHRDILICSKTRKEFYKEGMDIRMKEILEPEYDRIR